MSIKILAETWHEDTGEYKNQVAFDTFAAFYEYAEVFKRSRAADVLRVHIPARFHLSADDDHRRTKLGIERI